MGIPGPGAAAWALALLAWAALALVTGEFVRALAARAVSLWRAVEPIERAVLDFYLGGALVYAIAAAPIGAFGVPLLVALPLASAVGLVVLVSRSRPQGGWAAGASLLARTLARPAYLIALASAVGLFLVELATALPVATGNTFDSSLLTLYTSRLLHQGSIPLSFAPYATPSLLYPQGTTVWLGGAQLWYGPPAARTALLVTPLFLGLAPLAGFVFGRRFFGTERAGVATALVMAWIGPGTRAIVIGSNDFVFAFPLVLLLAGEAVVWLRTPVVRGPDALAFGILLGYSAALNPVGAEWMVVALPFAALLVKPRFGGSVGAWFSRWATMVVSALVGVIPSLYLLVFERSNLGISVGQPTSSIGGRPGISGPQFVGAVDPFLFGSSDTGLSPLAALRLELAILIVLGLAVLFLASRTSALGEYLDRFRAFAAGAAVAMITLLGVLWVADSGNPVAVTFAQLSSESELSWWLFALYGLIGTLPLALVLERFAGWIRRSDGTVVVPSPRKWTLRGTSPAPTVFRTVAPFAVAAVIVVPGVVLTPTELPGSLTSLYHDFGNVTAADFDLFEFAAGALPSGARVLVAPGSAGQFLPGYCPDIVVVFPMLLPLQRANVSYELLVHDLPNGTLGPADRAALAALDIQYVVVTGNSTTLWPAFSPRPFLAAPASFALWFHEDDAYVFTVVT